MDCGNILTVINNLAPCMTSSGMDAGLALFIQILLGVLIVMSLPLILVILLIWVERKFAARVQDRLGPNRVGPFGLLQNVADAIKLIIKEDITPAGADRVIYNVAPILMVVSVLLIWAVIPFTQYHVGVELDIGALYFVAVASFGTLAIMSAGWASNNKYALLGAFRVVAQLISYEVPMVFALLIPIMLSGTMNMQGIVNAQWNMWYVFMVPVAALLFFISSQGEAGRAPFDLLEAESELVAGFNIEYSGMKFGLFMAGEFIHVFTNGALMAVLFTGGWIGPFANGNPLLGLIYMTIKTTFWYLLGLLIRNTLPRFRIDQMMKLNWQLFVPLSIVNVLVVALVVKVLEQLQFPVKPSDIHTFFEALPVTAVLLLANLGMLAVVVNILRGYGRRERLADAARAAHQAKETDIVQVGAAGH